MRLHNEVTPLSLLPEGKAKSTAAMLQSDDDWIYEAIPWGDKYWTIKVSDDAGFIGYI
jgi:hypothetical protein